MDNLISRLSELRCQYNCFDENERDAYRTLSEAIKALSDVPDTNVGDTISRQAAINSLYTEIIKRRIYGDVNDGMLDEFDTESILRKEPSADVQPVRHGHWTLQEDRTKKLYGWHICSECGAWIGEPTNYCPNCGADMRGEQNDN